MFVENSWHFTYKQQQQKEKTWNPNKMAYMEDVYVRVRMCVLQ